MAQTTRRLNSFLLGLVVICNAATASAGDQASFVIPPRDGYGISECLAGNEACGRVVADSWCEAHGLAKASSFGLIDDITAAIPHSGTPQPPIEKSEPGSYVIRCEP